MCDVDERLAEFRRFVWNHAEDAFQANFDVCAELDDEVIEALFRILTKDNLGNSSQMEAAILQEVSASDVVLYKLLQLTGLTRNKIIQDIKAYVRSERLAVALSSPVALLRHPLGGELGARYLAKQLIRVFGKAKGAISQTLLEALNQATWPGYIRQERAKRMGHEAEYRLARLLHDCELPFAPAEKSDNPLCRDIQIGGMSYDLVSPGSEDARLRFVATVHTANIGQYGESKDELEIRKAVNAIAGEGRTDVILVAFIDGVGFESNRAGLTGVLRQAHEFCQFRTIWKAAVLAAHVSERECTVALPRAQHEQFAKFCEAYSFSLQSSDYFDDAPQGWVKAGDGYVLVGNE